MWHKLLFTMLALVGLICISVQTPAWAQWQLQTTLDGNPVLISVKAVSKDIAWTCSADGTVYRTIDGGKTWNITATKATTTEAVACIEALDADTAFVGGVGPGFAGGNAQIYRTTNGGQSWQVVYTANGPASAWDGIHFFDHLNGIAISDPPIAGGNFLIVQTNDGGTTWTPIISPPSANASEFGIINSFFFYDKLNGWFGTGSSTPNGNAGRIFRTTDGGNFWTGAASGNAVIAHGVRFISPAIGIRISSASPFLTRSVDGGQTWVSVNNLPVSNIKLLTTTTSANNTNLGQFWIAVEADSRSIISSINGGTSWQQQPIMGVVKYPINHISAVSFGDSVQAWAVTLDFDTFANGGEILTYRNRIGVVTSVKEQTQLPIGCTLSQNYPNPFNPSTVIRYALPKASTVMLKIFNLAGQEVATLVNRQQVAGEHTISWNAEKFPSGVYLYRLQAGEFSETKKMILMR